MAGPRGRSGARQCALDDRRDPSGSCGQEYHRGRPSRPVTLAVGETVTVRLEVSKPGDKAQVWMFRDVNRAGKFNTSTDYPFVSVGNIADGGGQDIDPAPGKVAALWHFVAGTPAGQYLLYDEDASSFTSLAITD